LVQLSRMISKRKRWIIGMGVVAFLLMLSPFLIAQYLSLKYNKPDDLVTPFPVSVDPRKETIIENTGVEAYFPKEESNQALVIGSLKKAEDVFAEWLVTVAIFLDERNLALVSSEKVVRIYPGLRKEEVAEKFARALSWDEKKKKDFLSLQEGQELPLSEGSFIEGVYVVNEGETPLEVQRKINERFMSEVLSRYNQSVENIVPLETALTVASLIQRETIGTDDMRMVSGIIWNRIFADSKLQLDATLQYAKASQKKSGAWWPQVSPTDKYIKSPYNTYIHEGLPPTPIASPSVAAVVAALNPVKTECMFYFHDKKGDLYCSKTYKEHVSQLKKIYGSGR
jgi:hypothetical protein